MPVSDEDVELVEQRYHTGERIARRALVVSDGDIAGAGSVIEAAREYRNLHRFEAFADDIEQLVRKGEVSLERAVSVLHEYNGLMGSAKAALDAHESDVHEGVRRFREGVQDFQGGRSSSESGSGDPETGASESTGESETGTVEPASGSDDPGAAAGTHPRGTVVVPPNKHYLQKLEARARDGQARLVETAYALTGRTYTRPTDLIPLDDDEFYLLSTRTSTNYNVRAMAEEVARSYSGASPPKVVAKFHTHPGGVPSPSRADRSGAQTVHREFVTAFGTDDFEFFHGIHGLTEHGRSVPPTQRHQPWIDGDRLVWDDETFRHRIAVYGPEFRTQKPIRLAGE